jgi:segregation and condensation protein A
MLPSLRGESYQVRLPVFEGPLDLLLHLIEREKLDISTVSIAQITDQFVAYIKTLEDLQPHTLADFLVMAARLVYIKSRLLLPQPAAANAEEEEDPGEALARQLREYKRFREAAQMLHAIEETGYHSYVHVGSPPELERRLETSDLTLADLLSAALSAFVVQPPTPPVGSVVTPFKMTIRDQIAYIRQVTADNHAVSFRSLLQHAHQRVEIVVTLLAVLELIKRRYVVAEQDNLFGEIMIRPIEGAELAPGAEEEKGSFIENEGETAS